MTEKNGAPPSLPNLLEQRERTVERLKEGFSAGYLSLADFETRVTLAENSREVDALGGLVSDLPQAAGARGVSESEIIHCHMAKKKVDGSLLQTKVLNIESSMSTVILDYLPTAPPRGVQEIRVSLTMSNLILHVPDDVVVENATQEEMSTFKQQRPRSSPPGHPKTILRITGVTKMSTIRIKRKKYWFFSKKS